LKLEICVAERVFLSYIQKLKYWLISLSWLILS